jgi:hypothetical protein
VTVINKINGQQGHTIGVEHTLATITDPGHYQLKVDYNDAADNEVFEVRYYTKARSTDTERQCDVFTVVGKGSDVVKRFSPVATPHHLKVTSKQLNGTGRSLPWEIDQL